MKLISYSILSIILLLSVIQFAPKYVTIKDIKCKTPESSCGESTILRLETLKGQSVQNALNGAKDILGEESTIENYDIKYAFPSSLSISLEYRRQALVIKYVGFTNVVVADKNGNALNVAVEENTPVLLVEGNPDIKKTIPLVININRYYGLKYFSLKNDALSAKTPQGINLIIPIDGDLDVSLGAISLTLSQLNRQLQGIRIKEIDFRYKNPVIR